MSNFVGATNHVSATPSH